MDLIQNIYQTVAKVVYYFRTIVQKRRKSAFFFEQTFDFYKKMLCI